ncbi:hypothetical protein NQ317_016868 [Molorchus minor]|uniref:Uncharacterized protein n=1 Tax=Molorchus minor TaxID=1323400 RepID=A0ABQ9J0S4_9CUCU|nr:hypothetical protein NQ317_016868 [Molorchus minor]
MSELSPQKLLEQLILYVAFKLHCNMTGLGCLNINYNDLAVLKPSWANRPGLYCDCLPSCTEIELSVIRDAKKGISSEYAIVELSLERLPTERYKRNVVRGKLDLVVSMGGAMALFLGASILSFVEIIYYFSVKPLTDRLRKYQENKNRKRFIHRNGNIRSGALANRY